MKCPYCGHTESKVVDSRHSEDFLSIRRRRECCQCLRRFTTYEIVESLPMVVVKKNGARQDFDRNKILSGMKRSCANRPVPTAELIPGLCQSLLLPIRPRTPHSQQRRKPV